jgi:ParB family transcriptional regulator, chromosome partitioning protein
MLARPKVGTSMTETNMSNRREIIRVLVESLIEDNIREGEDDPAELDRLGSSLVKHQDYPIIIRSNRVILDGHRRVRAAKLKGLSELNAIVVDGELTRDQAAEIAVRTAVHRKSLSDWERCKAVRLIAAAHPAWSRSQLAEHLDLDGPEVTKLLTEGVLEVEEAYRQGRIGLSVRYELARLPADRQSAMLAAKLSGGATRDDIAAASRRQRASTKPADRATRIRIDLPSGISVTFSGEAGLSLDLAIEAAGETTRELKRGRDQGLTAKTISKVSTERARKIA